MLISFKVSNFRSMRDTQEFSMYRTGRRHTDAPDSWKRPDLSPVAAIYGSNAAGKSTFVDALRFVTDAVEDSYRQWDIEGGVPRVPFMLDLEVAKQPSEFEIEFTADDGKEYQYGFSVDDERILTEHLYVYRTNRRTVLFERNEVSQKWYFGPSFKGPSSQIRETTRNNSLFLSAAAAAKNRTVMVAFKWLSSTLRIYNARAYEAEHRQVVKLIQKDPEYRSQLLTFLKRADLGVEEIDVVHEELDEEDKAQLEEIFMSVTGGKGNVTLEDVIHDREMNLSLSHTSKSANVKLPFDWESDGTRALISFASLAVRALEKGSVCVIDEIDTSLHPLLVAELVSVFADPRVNIKQAQLVFTTHDVSLLDRSAQRGPVLERDQIWVVEKDHTGASSMVAIAEYRSPRKEENLGRGYMTGRFGGLPALSIVNELVSLSLDLEHAEER